MILFTFIGLLVGEAIGVAFNHILSRRNYLLFSFCGGVLVGMLLFELIPESVNTYTYQSIILGVLCGLLFIKILDQSLHQQLQIKTTSSLHSFIIMVIAIGLHNIPLGIAYGLSSNSQINSTLLIVSIFHQIPEGLALAITYSKSKKSKFNLVLISLCLSVTLGAGTMIGVMNGGISMKLEGLITGITIGSILFVSCHELIWKSKSKGQFNGFLTSLTIGLIFVYLYFKVFMTI